MSGDPAIRVLIAEDELNLGDLLKGFLAGRGFRVTLEADGRSALRTLRARPHDVAVRAMATEMNSAWAERSWLFLALCRPARLNAGLTAPPLAVGSDGAEKFLGIRNVAGDVVVPKDDYLPVERGILRRDFLHRTLADSPAVHESDGAEIAAVGTSAGRKQNTAGMVAPVK